MEVLIPVTHPGPRMPPLPGGNTAGERPRAGFRGRGGDHRQGDVWLQALATQQEAASVLACWHTGQSSCMPLVVLPRTVVISPRQLLQVCFDPIRSCRAGILPAAPPGRNSVMAVVLQFAHAIGAALIGVGLRAASRSRARCNQNSGPGPAMALEDNKADRNKPRTTAGNERVGEVFMDILLSGNDCFVLQLYPSGWCFPSRSSCRYLRIGCPRGTLRLK